jgi:hypothetical protein
MPIERQSAQYGIFEDLPMPERTASIDPDQLGDLLAAPGIVAGLMGREAMPAPDPYVAPRRDRPAKKRPAAKKKSARTAAPMMGLGEGGSSWDGMLESAPTTGESGRLYTSLPGAAFDLAKEVNLDPSLRGDGNDTTAWNPGPKVGGLGIADTAGDALRIARQLLAELPPGAPMDPNQQAAPAPADPAAQQAAPAPQQQQAPQPVEPPTHLWDAEGQQPACGVDQPINVSSNPQETTCAECQIAMQRREQEMQAEQMKQLMQNPMQAMGRRTATADPREIYLKFLDMGYSEQEAKDRAKAYLVDGVPMRPRSAAEHQPVDVHELLEDTVPDPEDRPEPDPDGEPPHLEMLRAQEDGEDRKEAARKYSGPACECGCPIQHHIGSKGLRCRCGGCDNLTVRV